LVSDNCRYRAASTWLWLTGSMSKLDALGEPLISTLSIQSVSFSLNEISTATLNSNSTAC